MAETKEMVVANVSFATPIAEEMEMKREITDIEHQASALAIRTKDEYAAAAEFGTMLKKKASQVTEFFAPMKKAAHEAHKQICEREKAMLTPLTNAENIIKKNMGAWADEQERKRRAEEERLRKIAEAEAQRLLEAAAKESESGNETAADAMLDEAVVTSNIGGNITVAPVDLKQKGVGLRKEYEIVSIDKEKVPVTFNGMELRPVDTKAVMSLIKASKGKMQIPGIKYIEKTAVSLSRK